jgi:hypothetical protein
VGGGILVLIGVGWLLEEIGVTHIAWDALLPAVLILVGLAIAIGAAQGRSHGGLTAIGVVLTVVLVLGATLTIPFTGGFGERTARPTSVDVLERAYELGVGKLEVDLSDIEPVASDVSVTVRVGVGEVRVIVSDDAAVDIRASSGIGEVIVFGGSDGGFGVDSSFRTPEVAGPVLRIEASAGIGKVEVARA